MEQTGQWDTAWQASTINFKPVKRHEIKKWRDLPLGGCQDNRDGKQGEVAVRPERRADTRRPKSRWSLQ